MYGMATSGLHHYPFTAGTNYSHFPQSPFAQRNATSGSLVYGSGYPEWGLHSAASPGFFTGQSREAHDYLSPCAVSSSPSTTGTSSHSPGSKPGASPMQGQNLPSLYSGYINSESAKSSALAALSVNTALKEVIEDKQPGEFQTPLGLYDCSYIA